MKVRVKYDETIERTAVINVDENELAAYLGWDDAGQTLSKDELLASATDEDVRGFLEDGDQQEWAPLQPLGDDVVGAELRAVEIL